MTYPTDPQEQTIEVPCPTCGAPDGSLCRNLVRKDWLTIHPHQARKVAYQTWAKVAR